MVGGLLFLAFAYLAVGQAAANRSDAQTAADAAALAVAQDVRDQLAGEWIEVVLDPAQWQDIFDGYAPGVVFSCARGHQLAGQNDAHVTGCHPIGPLEFAVGVKMDKSVGDSIVPGTEDKYSKASAQAVIEARCAFELPGEEAEDDELPRLTCEDRDWDLDPENLTDLPRPEDLFDVHLAD